MSAVNNDVKVRPTVLIVDDTPATLRLLSEHLEAQGYRTLVAVDGEEAVQRVRLVRPNLVLMDVMMPVLDGFSAARHLQASPDTKDIPIIFMTSLHDTESKVAGFAAGAVDYVNKPLQLDEVTARIRTHLALQELRSRLQAQNELLQQEVAERKKAEDALRDAYNHLDQRVQERTAELGEANKHLLAEMQERKKAEAQLMQAQKMEAFGQLAGGVAHDFNNILTVILGQAECVRFTSCSLQDYSEALREILEAGERAKNLTRQLLVFSRKQAMQRANVDLVHIVNDLAKMLRRLIGEDIRLGISATVPAAPVYADASMIEQVILNMAVNSRDAMPQGGSLLVEISEVKIAREEAEYRPALDPGDYIVLKVADTGSGIKSETLPFIFEPFFTTKELGHGTGLGLATSLSIVQQHGGRIEVDSSQGSGTEFRIFLPKLVNGKVRSRTTGHPFVEPSKGKGTILLVEDEAGVRRSSSRMMQRMGYSVIEAESGDAALEIWRSKKDRIDLVLSDIVMPGILNGRTLAAQLHQEKPDLPILLMSGYDPGLLDIKAPGMQTIQLHTISKPFQLSTLIEAIQAELGQ